MSENSENSTTTPKVTNDPNAVSQWFIEQRQKKAFEAAVKARAERLKKATGKP